MKNRKLRWGLLSTARINNAIIPGLQTSHKNELVAVASRTKERAEAYATQHHIPLAFASYEEILDCPDIDVIYNPLPNHMHAEWTIKAAKKGKHTLCEKPIVLSTHEMESIITAARQFNIVVMEAFMYRHHPRSHKVMELLAQGKIGEVRFLRGSFNYSLTKPDDYRWNPAYGGGGLWDVGCYPLSYALMVTGVPPIQVQGWQQTGKTGIDEYFAGQLLFPNNVVAQLDCGTNAAFHTHFEIRGSLGTLWIPQPFNTRNNHVPIILRHGDAETPFTFADVEGYKAQTENMADAILGNAPPNLTLEQSAQINRTLLALFQSAREGTIIPF